MCSGILKYKNSEQTFPENLPDFFHDPGFDAIAGAILAGEEHIDIAPCFNTPPDATRLYEYVKKRKGTKLC